MKKEIFRIEHLWGLHKNGEILLKDISFELYDQDILGILVENSLSRTCLASILSGEKKPQRGRVSFKESPLEEYHLAPNHLLIVKEKSQLIENFSIAENIFIMRPRFKKFYINRRALIKQANFMLKKFDLKINASLSIRNLDRFQKVLVEIVKASILRIPVVVLENLSSFLSDREIYNLKYFLEKFKEEGLNFIILDSVSHVIQRLCSKSIIIRNGRVFWIFRDNENLISELALIRKDQKPTPKSFYAENQEGNSILKFIDFKSSFLAHFNLEIRKGEHTALLDSYGQQIKEFNSILKGDKSFEGSLQVTGEPLNKVNLYSLIEKKIAYIGETPEKDLYQTLSCLDNLSFCKSRHIPSFWMSKKYKRSIFNHYKDFFTEDISYQYVQNISSENQHSIAYLRWDITSPLCVILVRPLSSVDQKLENQTIKLIQSLIAKGTTLLILSSNQWELTKLSSYFPLKIKRLSPLS